MKWGILFRWRSLWIGAHWSPYNRRLCINLLPMITLWIVWPGGITPSQEKLINQPQQFNLIDDPRRLEQMLDHLRIVELPQQHPAKHDETGELPIAPKTLDDIMRIF